MNLRDWIRYRWDHIGFVATLINEWDLSGCASEKDCEDSLYVFLHRRLPDLQIVRQYARGRTHVDLMVDDKVMIELKYKLLSTSEYQRLVGQLVDYSDWGKGFILVLVGMTELGLLKDLEKEVERQFSGFYPFEKTSWIIQKHI